MKMTLAGQDLEVEDDIHADLDGALRFAAANQGAEGDLGNLARAFIMSVVHAKVASLRIKTLEETLREGRPGPWQH